MSGKKERKGELEFFWREVELDTNFSAVTHEFCWEIRVVEEGTSYLKCKIQTQVELYQPVVNEGKDTKGS